MKFASAAFISLVAGDIVLDKQKLVDFTTNWAWKASNLPQPGMYGTLLDVDVKGTLQLNLPGEKLKWTSSGDESYKYDSQMHHGPPAPPFLPVNAHDSAVEVIIDGPSGQATIADKGTLTFGPGGIGKMDGGVCLHVQIPARMVPPAGIFKGKVDSFFEHATAAANHFPHKTLANGNLVYEHGNGPEGGFDRESHYPDHEVSITIEPDGTPVSFHAELVCGENCESNPHVYHEPRLSTTFSFDSFTAGAGDVTAHSCTESSVLELTELPEELKQRFMHAADLFDAQMDQLGQNVGVSMPSLKSALQQQQLLAEQSQNQSAQQTWKVGLLAGVAGMAGGAVVLALDKVFKRRETPLLSEA